MKFNLWRKFKAWRKLRADAKFLANHDAPTWAAYKKKYDPLLSHAYFYGSVRNWYRGYPYIFYWDSPSSPIWKLYTGDLVSAMKEIDNWCEKNILGEYRHDFLQVIETSNNDWCDNCFGGDWLFFAFTDERDFVLFSLRWS